LVVGGVPAPQARAAAAPQDVNSRHRELGRRGLDLLMNGDLDAANEMFRQIQNADPQSALGYLLEADALWWRIYYSTANLVDPEVFVTTAFPSTPYDSHLEDLLNATISKAEAHIRANQDVARNYLYEGMAYGLRGRLAALREKRLPSARAGKKMRSLLLKALELDPSLTDAYLGVGTYNYFVDTLSPIVKILRFFIGLPGGSRVAGLQQLELAAQKGELTHGEAKFYLAKNLSRRSEMQYAHSLELFQELARQYPLNPQWPLLIGSLQFRLGRPKEGEALYREVLKKTAGETSEVKQALHRAVRLALQRRHPDQKFD